MKLLHVVGARPNFPKLAPVHRAAEAAGFDQCVVHTGQHYDDALSASFFRDLSDPPAGPQPRGRLARRMASRSRESWSGSSRPSSDTPPTGSWSTATSTRPSPRRSSRRSSSIRVAHVEAGLRSYDRTHARRDQSHRHRPSRRPPFRSVARRRRDAANGGRARRGDRVRRQRDDRFAVLRARRGATARGFASRSD